MISPQLKISDFQNIQQNETIVMVTVFQGKAFYTQIFCKLFNREYLACMRIRWYFILSWPNN